MQLSELIAAVRDEVQDQGMQRWADSTIIRYLNDAQLDLAQLSKKLTLWSVPVEGQTPFILRPVDLLIPKELWFEVGTNRWPLEIKYGTPPEASERRGDPMSAYLIGNHVYFYPTPSREGTCHISGTKRPDTLSLDIDVPEVEDADSLLIAYAVWMCFLSDGDPLAGLKEAWYIQRKLEWAILDAQKHPMPDRW